MRTLLENMNINVEASVEQVQNICNDSDSFAASCCQQMTLESNSVLECLQSPLLKITLKHFIFTGLFQTNSITVRVHPIGSVCASCSPSMLCNVLGVDPTTDRADISEVLHSFQSSLSAHFKVHLICSVSCFTLLTLQFSQCFKRCNSEQKSDDNIWGQKNVTGQEVCQN